MVTDRNNGVIIYIDETVAYEVYSTTGNFCFTLLTIRCFNTKNLIPCCIYKSPSTNNNAFLGIFEINT